MVTVNKECFLFSHLSADFRLSVFCHRAYCIRKHGKRRKFSQAIFRGIKTIYLVSSTFLRILCVQDTTPKVLLQVSLSIYCYCVKVAFLVIKPKWYLDTKLVALQQFHSIATVNNMCFRN